MKQCPHCHIRVGGSGRYCPLCHTPLDGVPTPDDTPWFPPSPPPGRRMPLAMKVLVFLLLAGALVCTGIDYLILEPGDLPRLHWSLAVWVCVAAALLLLRALFLGSHNAPKLLFQLLVGTALVAGFLDWFLGFGGVSYRFIIPILCSVTLVLNFLFAFVNRRFTENGLVYLLLNIVVGALPYLAFLLSPEQVPMAWTICLIVGIITFLSLVIFKGRDLWVELQKRLHL